MIIEFYESQAKDVLYDWLLDNWDDVMDYRDVIWRGFKGLDDMGGEEVIELLNEWTVKKGENVEYVLID